MNYFEQETNKIEDLKNFPFKNFQEFKLAVYEGNVNFGVAMDKAREWVTKSNDSPTGWRYFSNFLMLLPSLLIVFYIVMAFVLKNYWLVPYSVVPFIFMFIDNPIGRKVFKLHYWFIALYVVLAFFIKELWAMIYWLPLLLVHLSLNQLYGGSAQIVRENLAKNERLLCLFWKWWDLVIELKDGTKVSQKYIEEPGKEIAFYNDLDKDWKEYVDKHYKQNAPTVQEKAEVELPPIDPLTIKAIEIIENYDRVSTPLFQRRLGIGFDRASSILKTLVRLKVVEEGGEEAPRKVLMTTPGEIEVIKDLCNMLPKYDVSQFEQPLTEFTEFKDEIYPGVKAFALTQKTMSATKIQKQFGTGYSRACVLLDKMTEEGIIKQSKNHTYTVIQS